MDAVLAATVLTGLLAQPPSARAAACPDAGPCVVVDLPDGTSHVVTSAGLREQADVTATQYETRAVAGGATTDEPYVDHGLSIAGLLGGLGLDPSTVGFTETDRSDGAWSTLTRPDVVGPTDFADHLTPVLRVDGDVVEYVRPLRADPSDVNVRDLIRTAPGGALTLHVRSGALLAVSASVTPSTVPVGRAVSLSASAAGDTSATFNWDLGDGTMARARR